jgi:hypothetical protein
VVCGQASDSRGHDASPLAYVPEHWSSEHHRDPWRDQAQLVLAAPGNRSTAVLQRFRSHRCADCGDGHIGRCGTPKGSGLRLHPIVIVHGTFGGGWEWTRGGADGAACTGLWLGLSRDRSNARPASEQPGCGGRPASRAGRPNLTTPATSPYDARSRRSASPGRAARSSSQVYDADHLTARDYTGFRVALDEPGPSNNRGRPDLCRARWRHVPKQDSGRRGDTAEACSTVRELVRQATGA